MNAPSNAQNLPHENEGPNILGATLTVTIIALLTFATRLYVRLQIIRNVGWDDYVMGFAMVLCIVGQCLIIPEVYYGAGKHIWDIPPAHFSESYKLNFITQPIYLIAICTVKISIGFFLLRVAVTPFYRRTIIGIMTFMGFYTLGCFFTVVLQCTNLAVQWDQNAKGTCWGVHTLKALSYTNVGLNILTDLLFAIFIPIPMLWSVQMNRRQKGSIIGILSLGIFATAACLIKVGYLPNYGKTGDWLWDSRNITIWTVVECNVGIIAGNLPCLKPLFRTVLGSTYGRGSRNGKTPKYISRPYGNGSHGASKNYNELGSSKPGEDNFHSKAYGDESVMMTTINAKERSGSGSTSRAESPSKNSAESVAWLNTNEQGMSAGRLGGITRTTEVNIDTFQPSRQEIFAPERKEASMV